MLDFVQLGMQVDSRQVKEAVRDLEKLSRQGGATEAAIKGVGGAADRTEREVNQLATATDRAARETHQLARGADRAERQIKQMGGAAQMARSRIAGMVSAFAGMVAGAAGFGAAVRTIVSFDREMSKVAAITRASAGEMEGLTAVAMELGATTEFTAAQAAQGIKFLGMAGFEASEAMAAIPQVLDLATAAAMDLGRAADISSNIMSAFSIAATDAAKVTDVLAAASTSANTDVEQLGTAMSLVGPVASAFGISVNDTAAAIGKLSDAGLQGSMAGTGLRRILSSLANTTPQAAQAIEAMGLRVADLNPEVTSIVDIVKQFAEAGLSAGDALTIFGDRGGPAILALVSQAQGLEDLTAAMQNVEGASERMAKIMRDNLGGDLDSLVSATQGLSIALGQAGLTGMLRGAVQAVTGWVRALTGMVQGTQEVEGAIGALYTATKLLIDVTTGVVEVFGAVATAIVETVGFLADITNASEIFGLQLNDTATAAEALGVVIGVVMVGHIATAIASMVKLRNATAITGGVMAATSGALGGIGSAVATMGVRGAATAGAIGLMTRAVTALGVAARFLGGPWGLLVSGLITAGGWWLKNRNGANLLTDGLTETEAAMVELDEAMKNFAVSQKVEFAKATVDAAMNVRRLAQAARDESKKLLEDAQANVNAIQAQMSTGIGIAGTADGQRLLQMAEEDAAAARDQAIADNEELLRIQNQMMVKIRGVMSAYDDVADGAGMVKEETSKASEAAQRAADRAEELANKLSQAAAAAKMLREQTQAALDALSSMSQINIGTQIEIKGLEAMEAALAAGATEAEARIASAVATARAEAAEAGALGNQNPEIHNAAEERLAEFERGEMAKLEVSERVAKRLEALRETSSSSGGGGAGVDAVKEAAQAYDDLLASMSPLYGATRDFLSSQKAINDAFKAGLIEDKAEYLAQTDLLIDSISGEADMAMLAAEAEGLLNNAVEQGILTKEQAAIAADKLKDAYEEVNQTAERMGQDMARTFSSIIRGAESAKDAIANLASSWADMFLQNAFNIAWSNSGMGDILGGAFSMIGMNAQGTTYWRGGASVVGEEGMELAKLPDGNVVKLGESGPEIVDLPAGTAIYTAQASADMMREGARSAGEARTGDVAGAGMVTAKSAPAPVGGQNTASGGAVGAASAKSLPPSIMKALQIERSETASEKTSETKLHTSVQKTLESTILKSFESVSEVLKSTSVEKSAIQEIMPSGQPTAAGMFLPDLGAGSREADGTAAARTLGGLPPRSGSQMEPSRAEPRFSRFGDSGLSRGREAQGAPAQSVPEVKVEPVVEVYNFFDRDKFVGSYLDSPQGRMKVVNNVSEEQAIR